MAVAQVGCTLEIRFTRPVRATDGERLTKPIEIQIFRTVTAPGVNAPPAPATLNPWVSLTAQDLGQGARGQKAEYLSPLPESECRGSFGSTFTLAMRAVTSSPLHHAVESGLSNIAHVVLLDVSGPVESLRVWATEKAIGLGWSPAAVSLTGRPVSNLAGYNVCRSETGKPGTFRLLGHTDSPTYSDSDFQFGRTYFYKVRALFKRDGQVAESEDSLPAVITPRDVFPPAAPRGLTGLYTAAVVELIWNANREPDLAGYNVYRWEQGSRPERVNKELLRTPIYRDSSIEPDREYSYRVTAVDLSGNESGGSEAVAVEAR